MSGVNQYLKEKLSEAKGTVWLTPEIPEKKLNNAVNAFKYDGDPATIIAILDNTTFKSAKEGFAVSGSKLVYKEVFESPREFLLEDIENFENLVSVITNSKGKEKTKKSFKINKKDGTSYECKVCSLIDTETLSSVLNGALESFEDYEEQNQLEPIENLPEELKLAYLKVVARVC